MDNSWTNDPLVDAIHNALVENQSRCCDSFEDRLALSEAIFKKVESVHQVAMARAVMETQNHVLGVATSQNYWETDELLKMLGWSSE